MFGTQLMSRVVWIFFIPPCPHDLRSDTMITTIWQGSHNMYNNMISLSYNNRQGSKYIIGEHLINYPLSRADLLIKILMYIRRIEGMRVAPYRMWKGDWIIITDTHMLVAMIIVCFWIHKYSWSLFPFFPSNSNIHNYYIPIYTYHLFLKILIWKSSKFVSTNISINDFYL